MAIYEGFNNETIRCQFFSSGFRLHPDGTPCSIIFSTKVLIFYLIGAGIKHALLLGGGSTFGGIQIAYSKNLWLSVDCWRWHENAGSQIASICLSLTLWILFCFLYWSWKQDDHAKNSFSSYYSQIMWYMHNDIRGVREKHGLSFALWKYGFSFHLLYGSMVSH